MNDLPVERMNKAAHNSVAVSAGGEKPDGGRDRGKDQQGRRRDRRHALEPRRVIERGLLLFCHFAPPFLPFFAALAVPFETFLSRSPGSHSNASQI